MTPVPLFIVDDNILFARLLKVYIAKEYKYDISVFATGELCLAHLHLMPQIIILNYQFGGDDTLNGEQVLRVLQQCPWKPKVIFVSSQQDYSHKLLQLGIQAYIAKDSSVFSNLSAIMKAN
jgi:DNA-binding NarL/FixJ family response regulator